MQLEAHVYALAIAASVLLSFYPFLTVMLSFCRGVLHSKAAVSAIFVAINDYFPGEMSAFFSRNRPYRNVEYFSMVLLLFTANGIFEPLEVALNKLWGVKTNRTYVRNQLVSLGMIFLCGGLALVSIILTALNHQWLAEWAGPHAPPAWLDLLVFKLIAVPLSMLPLFFVYWLLPNRPIAPVKLVPVAILVGLALEVLKYVNLLVWPLIQQKLHGEYGVFEHSVTILFWSFLAAMIVLAGGEWAARAAPLDQVSSDNERLEKDRLGP